MVNLAELATEDCENFFKKDNREMVRVVPFGRPQSTRVQSLDEIPNHVNTISSSYSHGRADAYMLGVIIACDDEEIFGNDKMVSYVLFQLYVIVK